MAPLIELYDTDHAQLVNWIGWTHGITPNGSQFMNESRVRREAIARRLRFYRDQSAIDLGRLIDQVYETDDYKATLKRYVSVALEQNVSRRIVDEIASLYDRPALRIFKNKANNARFHDEEKRVRLHEIMQEAHRLTMLCNEVLIWQFKGVDNALSLRIVTPDMFDAIPHPQDALVPAGYLIDALPRMAILPIQLDLYPIYEVWDDTYRYLINRRGWMCDYQGNAVVEPIKHGLERVPGVLFHRREPVTMMLDSARGADIESAHAGVALLNLMIMRLSKSQGENQPVLSGNLAAMASGQTANGEKPLLLPPEVVASMLNMKTDPDHYITAKRDKITSVAQTYGMSYEQFTLQAPAETSGKAYTARREKLTEIRLESRRRAVLHEGLVADLMGFDPKDLRLDFAEMAIPQDAVEEVSLLADKMKMGLDSPVDFLMRKDPDLTREEAKQLMADNLADYSDLIKCVRALNMSTSGDASNPGQDPAANGAMSGEAGSTSSLKNAAASVDSTLAAANNGNGGNGSNGMHVGPQNAQVNGKP